MPTQEELNAAQVELGIANDNYAALANKYSQFQNMFAAYRDASPEKQALAAPTLDKALRAFEELKLDMYAAEDRIQQAQNRVANYNNLIANQARQQPTRQVKTYRQTPQGTIEEVIAPEVTEAVVETNTFWPTPSWSSRWRTYTYSMTPIKDFVNSVNTFPNKAKWTMEMISATPQAISALWNTAQAYNQMTTYNWLQQLWNNIQWWVNLVKSVPWIIKAGDRIYNAYNTYRGQ